MKRSTKVTIAAAALGGVALVGAFIWQSSAAESVPIGEVSHIHGIAVDPTDNARLYLATHFGLYRTSPDGTAEQVSSNSDDYMGFTRHPSDPNVLYASGHPSGGGGMGIVASRDGGQSWEQIAAGAGGPVDFHAMDISAADPDVMYGLYGRIQVSTDGGATWAETGAPPADVFDIAASAADPNFLYAATRDGVMVSRDQGATWSETDLKGQPVSMVATAPDGSVYAFAVGSGLFKTPGAAVSWKPLNNEFGERVLLHLAADPSDPSRLYAVTSDSELLASTDGGRTWAPLAS